VNSFLEPGRVDFYRPTPAFLFSAAALVRHAALGGLVAVASLACVSTRPAPVPNLAPVWHKFSAMPSQRALAIAGDPTRGSRWVVGASSGMETRERAVAEALSECQVRRGVSRLQAECVLYAVGDEIVWRNR